MPVILILRARKTWYPGAFCWLNRVEYTDISKISTEYEHRLREIKFLKAFSRYLVIICFVFASVRLREVSEGRAKRSRSRLEETLFKTSPKHVKKSKKLAFERPKRLKK